MLVLLVSVSLWEGRELTCLIMGEVGDELSVDGNHVVPDLQARLVSRAARIHNVDVVDGLSVDTQAVDIKPQCLFGIRWLEVGERGGRIKMNQISGKGMCMDDSNFFGGGWQEQGSKACHLR